MKVNAEFIKVPLSEQNVIILLGESSWWSRKISHISVEHVEGENKKFLHTAALNIFQQAVRHLFACFGATRNNFWGIKTYAKTVVNEKNQENFNFIKELKFIENKNPGHIENFLKRIGYVFQPAEVEQERKSPELQLPLSSGSGSLEPRAVASAEIQQAPVAPVLDGASPVTPPSSPRNVEPVSVTQPLEVAPLPQQPAAAVAPVPVTQPLEVAPAVASVPAAETAAI